MNALNSPTGCLTISATVIILTLLLMLWDNSSTDKRQKQWTD